jgi:uncharacterized protein GlcG (DUF336 family)
MPLTHARIQTLMARAIEKAEQMDLRITVAVVDADGRRRGLVSMDGARFTTHDIAWGKALACAGVQLPTSQTAERSGRPVFMYQMIHNGFVFAQGGVPITDPDGTFVGALAISGGPGGPVDEEIALYAAQA